MEILTNEQENVAQAEEPMMAVTAYAGTGKTSTLRSYARRRPHDRMLYLAFNKALAEEARHSFGGCPNVYVKTLHALAFYQVGKNYQKTLGNFRVYDLNRYFPGLDGKNTIGASRLLFDLINAWTMSSDMTIDAFYKKNAYKLADHLKEFKVSRSQLSKALKEAWDDMVGGRFTMTHNGYFKLFQLSKPPLEQFTYLLVDEAQDLNEAMLAVILGARGKKILVGDPYQQIYGWNGAVNAIGKAVKMGAVPYYLTQSFRCPEPVASVANKYLSLLGAEKKFHGIEGSAPLEKSHKCQNITIARTNAAIFDFAANNMKNNRIFYNGGFDGYQFDMLKDLNYLRDGKKGQIRDSFIKKFECYPDLESYVNQAQDGVMMVRIDVEKKYLSAVHDIFEKMRKNQAGDEKSADVVITTAHKVKGQEYGAVTLLSDFVALEDVLARADRAAENQDKTRTITLSREEFQLVYVAITRSFKSLYLPSCYLLKDNDIKKFIKLVRKKAIVLE